MKSDHTRDEYESTAAEAEAAEAEAVASHVQLRIDFESSQCVNVRPTLTTLQAFA